MPTRADRSLERWLDSSNGCVMIVLALGFIASGIGGRALCSDKDTPVIVTTGTPYN